MSVRFTFLCLVFLGLKLPALGEDCNGNGTDDDQDIADGTSLDCTPHNCCDADRWLPGCTDDSIVYEDSIEYCVCVTRANFPDYGESCCDPDFYWSPNCVWIAVNRCAVTCPTPGTPAGNEIPDECEIADCDPLEPDCGDCNGNGVPDICDIAAGDSLDTYCVNAIPDECENDCNCNSIADDSEIFAGTVEDCDLNGVPDQCATCPIDLVLALDTSGSMVTDCNSGDVPECEAKFICESLQIAFDDLPELYIHARVTVLAMAEELDFFTFCTLEPRRNRLSTYLSGVSSWDGTVPGTPGDCGTHLDDGRGQPDEEDWGPSTATLAQYFDWQPDSLRIVMPISDEGPCLGYPCLGSSDDGPAIANATNIALTNQVKVCPIIGLEGDYVDPDEIGAEALCVEGFATQIAADTGGEAVLLSEHGPFTAENRDDKIQEVAAAIVDVLVSTVARSCGDVNENGIPDACDEDCNENGLPDDYEIATGTAEDINANGIPDECEVELQTDLFVVVMDEPPVPVTFQVPPDSNYAFNYDPSRVLLWDSPTRDTLIVHDPGPLDELTAGAASGSCGTDLSDMVAFQICFTGDGGAPIGPECEPFDYDGDTDVDASDFEVFRPLLLFPICAQVTVYVEGVTQSSALDDTAITLLADPDYDGVLTSEEVRPLTVATVTVTASSGRLGAPVTITLDPAIPPLAFDGASTITFEGVYDPPIGDPTDEFQISYDAEEVCALPPDEAVIHVGDGTVMNAPVLEALAGPGVVTGTLTLDTPAATLVRTFSFAPETDDAEWRVIGYLDTSTSKGPPVLGGIPTSLRRMQLADNISDPPNPDVNMLRNAYLFHHAVSVRVESEAEVALAYSNTGSVTHPISYFVPGDSDEDRWVADDMRLATPGGCNALGYEVAVYAGTGGGQFNAHVELFDLYNDLFDFPGTGECLDLLPEGQGIPGTAMDFPDLPALEVSYLHVPLDTVLPERMWVYLSVSTSEAGWVLGNGPDVGSEAIANCYGGHSDAGACQMCFTPAYSMWARVYCENGGATVCDVPPPTLRVDVMTYDTSGFELDRLNDLLLVRQVGEDGDPAGVLYHSDLTTPIIFVDVPVNKGNYANFLFLQIDIGGTTAIVAAQE